MIFIIIMLMLVVSTATGMVCYQSGKENGLAIGTREGRELERKSLPSQPICMCGHGINYHNSHKGCRVSLFYTQDGMHTKHSFRCECEEYVGPQPLPEYYHPLELT